VTISIFDNANKKTYFCGMDFLTPEQIDIILTARGFVLFSAYLPLYKYDDGAGLVVEVYYIEGLTMILAGAPRTGDRLRLMSEADIINELSNLGIN
jgi:hypothetical protein